jgi:hypothetical protein
MYLKALTAIAILSTTGASFAQDEPGNRRPNHFWRTCNTSRR